MAEHCHNTPGMLGERPAPFSIDQIIKSDTPEDVADRANQYAWSIVCMVRIALENQNSGGLPEDHRASYAANALEVAEALMTLTTDGVELLQRQANRGHWWRESAA